MWKSSMIDTPEGYAFASDMKCFLSCDEVMLRELFMAFTKYADEQGIPRPSEDHLKGKLEATEKHLQDLQNQVQMLMHQNGRLMALVEGDKDGTNRSDQGVGNTPHRLTEQME
jgi:hypothetical protein